MNFENILISHEEGVGIITLNRPQVLNALNTALATELSRAIESMEEDPAVRCIVLTGAGERAFSAGRDIHEMASQGAEESATSDAILTPDYTLRLAFGPKPTIGAINGLAYGGGALLASALDIRLGCERSQFRFLGTAFGRVNSTWTLAVQIGMPKAKELLLSGRVVEAEEALATGLLNHLVPSDQLMAKTLELARLIAQNPPQMVQAVKEMLNEYVGMPWPQMASREQELRRTRLLPPPVEESFSDFLARHER